MVRTAFTVLAWMCGASLAADPAPAAPDPAEPIPTDFDGVVSTEDLWSLIGSNGELRELWRGPPERIDTHGGEPPRVLKVSAFGEVREGESWRDLRTLAWVDDGSRPGRMRLRDANGVARLTAEARRGEDGAPIVLRFAFSAPKALRFRVSLPVGGPALSTEGAAVVIPDGPASRLTIVSRPPGSAASSGRAASIEVPPVAEIAIEVFPGKDRREPGGPPPPALPRIETGLPELDHLLEASVEAIEANSFRSGVVIAGSDGWYKNAWIRDGTYSVLGADLAGRRDLATRFFRFWLREGGFSWGGENEAQQPAIGILGMRTHALLLPPEEAAAFLREAYPYVKRYGDYYAGRVEKEGMIGTAEEWICQVPAPCSWPNAEVHAGLAAGSKIAEALAAAAPAIPTAGADAARWKAAAARLKEKIAEEAYDPKLGRFIPLAGPPGAVHKDEKNPGWSGPLRDERVDSGMLMLARSEVFGRGLGAVAVDDPRFISTQAAIGEVLSQSDRSISRFDGNLASPSYPGGEWPMWPISAAWAAQIEFLRGRTDAAWDHLLSGILKKTGVDHAEALLQLPEQWRYDGRPVRTTRLLTWSHGELLTATVFLLLGLDLDPEGADLGLSPSIPPGSRGASIKGWPFRGWELEIRIAPSEEGAKMQVKGKRGPKGPEILQIATPKGTVKLADGDEAVIQGRRPSASAGGGIDPEALRAARVRRQEELKQALGPGWESSAGPLPPQGLRVSTIFTAQEMRRRLADGEGREKAVEWCRRYGVDHAFVESFRDGYDAPEATLVAVRDRFRAAGLAVSGCVTPTKIEKQSTGWKDISCYTSPKTRAKIREVFAAAAKLFDEVMIDDFLFTDCRCEECQAARGSEGWPQYHMRIMREVSARDILGVARAVRPGVRIIIKYPQWYDDFHNRGYDVLGETALYPAIWVGTETRDPDNARWGRKAQYEAYYIMRWLGGIGGTKTGGGWFDPYGTSPVTYVEQARQTVLAGAREMLLFCHDSLIKEENAACPEALLPEFPGLRELARRLRGRAPLGIAAPKPPHSQPSKGEDYFFDYVGMVGIPLVPCTEISPQVQAALITSHSAGHPATVAWLRAAEDRPVIITPAAENALPAGALGEGKRPVARLSWNKDPREVMDLPREELDRIRERVLAPLGIRLSAPGRVALYLFDDLAALENFNDSAVEVLLDAGVRPAEEKDTIVLPPSRTGEVRRERRGDAVAFGIPPRTLIAFRLMKKVAPGPGRL